MTSRGERLEGEGGASRGGARLERAPPGGGGGWEGGSGDNAPPIESSYILFARRID